MNVYRKRKFILNITILILSCLWLVLSFSLQMSVIRVAVSAVFVLVFSGLVINDWFRLKKISKQHHVGLEQTAATMIGHELILLDEHENPIKSWELTGKTAVVLGRRHKDADVDIDLSNSEFSALIDVQHAVLNYSLDNWYLEDLDSKNGIRIKKIEDGICYQVTQSRPCRISAGDVIYIAKTKLLYN